MAGNSVPVFFGAKARTKKPPGIDVTSITDTSGSMRNYVNFITSISVYQALETALVSQGVGVLSTNRYSFCGANRGSLNLIEATVTVDRVIQRWALGDRMLNGTVSIGVINGYHEDVASASNQVEGNDRDYLPQNERIIIAGSDEQSGQSTAFIDGLPYPHRYVGVHDVALSVTEPAGPNPVPAGTLIGFVYTTAITGAAIYNDGGTLNYRLEVPVAKMNTTAVGGTLQVNIDRAKTTNGAIYDIDIDFALLGESLGTVLGQYLYDIS